MLLILHLLLNIFLYSVALYVFVYVCVHNTRHIEYILQVGKGLMHHGLFQGPMQHGLFELGNYHTCTRIRTHARVHARPHIRTQAQRPI